MTDRELLEAAAKAAGIYYWIDADAVVTHSDTPGSTREWNPLTNSGDAFELAVKLGLLVDVWLQQKVCIASNQGEELVDARVEFGADPYAAARRAIVRAAAEIGRNMK